MNRLRVSDFQYDLPASFIAQQPAGRREDSRLLVFDALRGRVAHRRFRDIGEYLGAGSMLVLNDTKVIPARLIGRRERTGGRVEVLLLRDLGGGEWECLLNPSAKLGEGSVVVFDGSAMTATVGDGSSPGTRRAALGGVGDVAAEIERIGHVPIPPYIKRPRAASRVPQAAGARGAARRDPLPTAAALRAPFPDDRERYQTVYARSRGAVAAPTAGLHFSGKLLMDLSAGGVDTASITLHVGLGSFRPVTEEFVAAHRMQAEYFEITAEAAESINRAREEGARIVVVGTTAARALEAASDEKGRVRARSGWTELFIYPPYRFKLVRNLLTNFHLPCSTLLMLVAALAGRETTLGLYETAKREGYRFYSYGDAMLVLNPKSQRMR